MYYEIAEYLLEATTQSKAPNTSSTPTSSTKPKPAPKKLANTWLDRMGKEIASKESLNQQFRTLLNEIVPDLPAEIKKRKHNMAAVAVDLLTYAKMNKPTYNSSLTLLKDLTFLAAKIEYDKALRSSIERYYRGTEKEDPKIVTDSPIKKWEPYKKFRKDMFKVTVGLGWPVDVKLGNEEDLEGTPINKSADREELWKASEKQTPYFFAKLAPNVLDKKTVEIREKIMNNFSNKPEQLRALISKVDQIVEHEKEHFKKGSTVLNVIGAITMFVFQGFGGQERDLAFFKWFNDKFKTMTIFEYQQAVLEDVKARMDISDDSASRLKIMLTSLYKELKTTCENSKGATLDPIRTYRDYDENVSAYIILKPSRLYTSDQNSNARLLLSLIRGFEFEKTKTGIENGVLVKLAKALRNSKNPFSAGPSVETLVSMARSAATSKGFAPFVESIDDEPIVFELWDVDRSGKKIGKFVYEFKLVPRNVKVSLSYDSEGVK